MVDPRKRDGDHRIWYWPPAILLGVVIGLAALDGVAGIAVGIAFGIAFGIALAPNTADREDDTGGTDDPGPGKGPGPTS
ncbi:hypothetical protein KIF24_25265 [Micromonospora sp. Llam7]|uniref:hypothetical protein n=1 Tax=Micromonospora tarapacensis TaxID=2835305 RepID=UPI001C83CEC1|nr:hypothetical protein [Micromonospora tarapacensis]MBX7269008.1 hypothetical protein [Micromonospora tarapacensis]